MPTSFNASSEQFWMSAVVMAFIDIAFILLLMWRIKPSRFRELKWTLVGTGAIFWGVFAASLVLVFWDSYYHYFFPGWFRSGGTLLYVPLLYGLFALTFHWLSLRVPGNPIVIFCLLGGAESLVEHLWGIYGIQISEVPMLQGVSAASILAISFPEYVFYWCIVISIAVLLQNGWRWVIKLIQARRRIAS